jgi:hypothetical protein
MGLYHLEKIFDPKTVAVIGASSKSGTIGQAIIKNLVEGGYEGKILPVNPKYSDIEGFQCYKSILEAKEDVDLAIISTPIATAADLELLEEMLVCLSHLLVDFPQIAELDMNPVIVKDGRPCAVDARIIVRDSEVPSPRHLVISPYPEQYESREVTEDGVEIYVRPIKPEDAQLLLDLFDRMSKRSRYYRFFTPLKTLSREMLVRLTQVDYDRHIALVALQRKDGKERMVGVARVISDPGRKSAEFSVAVGDPWQGRGIGRKLLERSL